MLVKIEPTSGVVRAKPSQIEYPNPDKKSKKSSSCSCKSTRGPNTTDTPRRNNARIVPGSNFERRPQHYLQQQVSVSKKYAFEAIPIYLSKTNQAIYFHEKKIVQRLDTKSTQITCRDSKSSLLFSSSKKPVHPRRTITPTTHQLERYTRVGFCFPFCPDVAQGSSFKTFSPFPLTRGIGLEAQPKFEVKWTPKPTLM